MHCEQNYRGHGTYQIKYIPSISISPFAHTLVAVSALCSATCESPHCMSSAQTSSLQFAYNTLQDTAHTSNSSLRRYSSETSELARVSSLRASGSMGAGARDTNRSSASPRRAVAAADAQGLKGGRGPERQRATRAAVAERRA